MYDPKTNKYPYPEDTAAHYLVVKKDDGTVFDSDYPYIDTSRGFLIKRKLTRILLRLIVFPVARVRLGLKIEGKENLKKHKDTIEKGVISVCNHIHLWDYICILSAIKPVSPYILAWDKNIRGENGKLIRLVGGIPIPTTLKATLVYMKTVEDMIKDGGWLHIYSEGSMWEYYQPIRPFKQGAAYFSCECGRPILPMAFSYREPSFIRKKIFRQLGCLTLSIGEPLFGDESLPKRKLKRDLTVRSHKAVCRLAGIEPEDNIYPPEYNNSKRVDY